MSRQSSGNCGKRMGEAVGIFSGKTFILVHFVVLFRHNSNTYFFLMLCVKRFLCLFFQNRIFFLRSVNLSEWSRRVLHISPGTATQPINLKCSSGKNPRPINSRIISGAKERVNKNDSAESLPLSGAAAATAKQV